MTHYIYHVPGIKVGCTKNVKKRMKGSTYAYEILETLHGFTDQEAGDLEWYWADWFGHDRGSHYIVMMRIQLFPGSFVTMTSEQQRVNALRANQAMLPDRKSAIGRAAAAARVRNLSFDRLSEIGRNAGRIGGRRSAELRVLGCQIRTSCPHCGKESNMAILHRWHFDNCKKKKV